jgi:hypothetical protein
MSSGRASERYTNLYILAVSTVSTINHELKLDAYDTEPKTLSEKLKLIINGATW